MSTVYIITALRENKFGWTPDISDATKYGKLKIIFESSERPQFNPQRCIGIARKVLKDFNEEDFLLWVGGGDPIAVMIACMVASEFSDEVNVLRWERNFNETERDRRKGWYMPVKMNME